MKQRVTLRSEVVVGALVLLAFAFASPALIGVAWGIWLLAALVVAMVIGALVRPSAPILAPDGIRFVHRWLFDKRVALDAIAETRMESFMGQSWLLLLGEGGARLGSVPMGKSGHLMEQVLRALGPRNKPVSLEDLARPRGASVAEWKAALDKRAHHLSDPSYRASPEAEIVGLEAAIADAANALDVRAGAAYVLVQSGVESALRAARRSLERAPPLAIAMARAAKGGEAVVSEASATDALDTIGHDDAEALSARGRLVRAEVVDEESDEERSEGGHQRGKK